MLGDDGFKYLGRLLEVDLNERCLKEQIQDKLRGWMNAVDSCHVDGVMKCWIYNFVIISKLSWSFTVGGLSVSFARNLHSMHVLRATRQDGCVCTPLGDPTPSL